LIWLCEITRKTRDFKIAWYVKVTFPLSAFVRKQRDLDMRRTQLEAQMRALDLQACEFREQVSIVASREADLKDRIAKLKKLRRDNKVRRSAVSLILGGGNTFRFVKPPCR